MAQYKSNGCCWRRKTFCCCCSVRTGASVIGWFNFIFNSLYVGMMVLSLAKIQDELGEQPQFDVPTRMPRTTTPMQVETEGSGVPVSTQAIEVYTQALTPTCLHMGKNISDPCICAPRVNFVSGNVSVCEGDEITCAQCVLNYIEKTLVPIMYKSLAIPGFLLVLSIAWLTAVESRSLWYVRYTGMAYIFAIFAQTIMQLSFLGFGNKKLVEKGFSALTWPVWLVFGIYAALNVYFIPILYKYITLRAKEASQGIEQGLLTSEPSVQSRPLDVDLEDAFAIDSEGEMDVFRCTIEDNHANYGSSQATVVTTGTTSSDAAYKPL